MSEPRTISAVEAAGVHHISRALEDKGITVEEVVILKEDFSIKTKQKPRFRLAYLCDNGYVLLQPAVNVYKTSDEGHFGEDCCLPYEEARASVVAQYQ